MWGVPEGGALYFFPSLFIGWSHSWPCLWLGVLFTWPPRDQIRTKLFCSAPSFIEKAVNTNNERLEWTAVLIFCVIRTLQRASAEGMGFNGFNCGSRQRAHYAGNFVCDIYSGKNVQIVFVSRWRPLSYFSGRCWWTRLHFFASQNWSLRQRGGNWKLRLCLLRLLSVLCLYLSAP